MKHRPHQRDSETNQQASTAVRPPLPRDASGEMTRWKPGQLPKGGYRSTFDFSKGPYNTKKSPSRAGGLKVVKEQC